MVYFERGHGYEALGEYAAAKQDYERAREFFPLERWQQEAASAIQRVEESQSAGGTLTESLRRLSAIKKLDPELRRKIISAISAVRDSPVAAGVELRNGLARILRDISKQKDRRSIFETINELEGQPDIPDVIIKHMNTVRVYGNIAVHDKPVRPTDLYPSVTAMLSILEWQEAYAAQMPEKASR